MLQLPLQGQLTCVRKTTKSCSEFDGVLLLGTLLDKYRDLCLVMLAASVALLDWAGADGPHSLPLPAVSYSWMKKLLISSAPKCFWGISDGAVVVG